MKTQLIGLLLLLALPATGQLKNFRISAGINYPLISEPGATHSRTLTLSPASGYSSYYTGSAFTSERYTSKPGFLLTTSFDAPIRSKFFLRSGLTFTILNFSRTSTIESFSSFKPVNDGGGAIPGIPISGFYGYGFGDIFAGTGEFEMDANGHLRFKDISPIKTEGGDQVGKTRLSSLHVPLMAGASFLKDRINVMAGGVLNIVTHASVHELNIVAVTKANRTEHFTSVSPGAMIMIDFKIYDRVSAEISGQHFFSPLYKSDYRVNGKSYLTSCAAGLSYRFAR